MVYKGTEGYRLKLEFNVPIESILNIKLDVLLPNGFKTEWFPKIDKDSNEIVYITQRGDLEVPGKYFIQPWVELDSGFKGYGEPVILVVKDNFQRA